MQSERPRGIDRRAFLLSAASAVTLGASSLILAACTPSGRESSKAASSPTPMALTPHSGTSHTVSDLLATTPFYIAHRGSRDNWPEHTMQAYSHSVALGAKAIEVSVNATRDGVLICHHDTDMQQTSGSDLVIASVDWSELSQLKVDERQWLGPAATPQPIPLLKDVLDKYARTHVIFIEDKQGTNTAAMLKLMDSYPDSHEHFVWKQPATAAQYQDVSARGYRTWGYFTSDMMPQLDSLASRFDYLGAMHTAPDSDISRLVAVGKPVIVWEVHYRAMQERLLKLGVAGMMCSNLPYVAKVNSPATADAFATGLRAAGDLPWTIDEGTALQPTIDPKAKSLTIDHADVQSYLMGSLAPIAAQDYTISTRFRWPQSLPAASQHGGIAFGQADDSPYRVGVAGTVGGYHVILRADGSLQLYSRAPGVAAGRQLQSVSTTPPRVGEWIDLAVHVTPDSIEVTRSDAGNWHFTAADSSYRGGYFWLCKNYPQPTPIEFSRVTVR